MKKDWTEIMRDKLSESAVTPPDDLWTGISSELDAVAAPKKRIVKPIIWRCAAVAASLAALVICGVYFYDFNNGSDAPAVLLAQSIQAPVATQRRGTEQGLEAEQGRGAASSHKPNVSTTSIAVTPQTEDVVGAGSSPSLEIGAGSSPSLETESCGTPSFETCTGSSPSSDPAFSDEDDIDYEKLLLAQAQASKPIEAKSMHRKRMSLSLFACNTNIPTLGTSGDSNLMYGDQENGNLSNGQPPTDFVDDPDQSSTEVSRSSDSYRILGANHKQPIRFGLSARIPISDSFSIGTGVTYSRLSSSITFGNSANKMYEVDQTLHYIGVPVSLDYNLPSYRSVSFYLTAGAMTEKCIYGQSRVSKSPSTESVKEGRLQLSVFAGVGMQFNLNDHISLYAEPLATYYFDDHSGITNIYKDRPLNIDLRIGLRYTFR